ncbi:hypothetical protein GCM10027280_43100 [Micromonospora polyrhachis]
MINEPALPGMELSTSQDRRQSPVPGRESAEAGGFAGADAVFDAGVGAVSGFEVLDAAVAGWGVGGHDLVPPAFDGVEQGQLGAGVWAFAADEESGALRPAGRVEQAGDLADLGAFT